MNKPHIDLGTLLKAASFSADKHKHQKRKGIDPPPYINHPLEVASILANVAGVTDLTTLVAALLHDTVEDTGTKPEEIEALFGRPVRLIVAEVTDDKTLPKPERKRLQIEHAPTLSAPAKMIKISDKICNIREVARRPPEDWSLERRREYLDWAEKVVAQCGRVNNGLEREFQETLGECRTALSRVS